IDGGAGEDLTTYTSATGPVTVDLTAGTGGQAGEHDVLSGIEDVTVGGTLIGDEGPNFLTGSGGGDVISGNGGDDTLVGEAGSDTLGGGAGDDRVYGDTTFGDGAGTDALDGGPGDDRLDGGGGADQLDGGPGFDILDYTERSHGVDVDLRRAAPQGEAGEGDSATGVEAVYGGAGNDTLVGDDGDNVLHGDDGDDTLRGLGGADTLDGGAGVNVFDCVGSDDKVVSGPQDSFIACAGATTPPPGGDQNPPMPGGGGAGQNQGPHPSPTVQATRLTVRLLAKTLRLGRDGKLALRVNASAAGTLTVALRRGTVTYLRKSVTVKRGASTLHLKLSASMTRKLRKPAKLTLKLSLGTLRADVVVKRA
ncbi:MAG TPA: calcium-binding protein, partial [Solirubrobacter sp.]